MQTPSITELQTELTKHFGFRIPEAFAHFIKHALDENTKEDFFDYWSFFNYYHFFDFNMPVKIEYDWDKAAWTYTPNETYESYYDYGLPPELQMFGSIDSLRFAYIVHDPSLQYLDWPVGKVAEMDLGVIKYGDNTREGLESLISFAKHKYKKFGQENESYAIEANEKFKLMEKVFGLDPSRVVPEEQSQTYDAGERILRPVPVVPEGWHFEPSPDGIGVLAPAAMFAPDKPEELGDLEDTKEVKKLIRKGYYATALLVLRAHLWKNWHGNDPFNEKCALLLQDVYMKMDRPAFAKRVQLQIDYARTLNF
jgi:hypothetical protein